MQELFSQPKSSGRFEIEPATSETPPARFPLKKEEEGGGFFEIKTDLTGEKTPALKPTHGPVEEPLENVDRIPRHGSEIATLLANVDLLLKHSERSLAQHLLRQSLYLNSHHPETLKRLASCLNKETDLEIKTKVLETLVRSDLHFDHMAQLAHCYYLQSRDQEALQTYREALTIQTEDSPETFEVYKNLGNLLIKDGDFDGAEELYHKAFTLDPRSDVLMVNFGTLALQRQDTEEALNRFRLALELNARNDKAWVGLAMVHNLMGDFVLAKANVENAIDLNPQNRTAVQLAATWAIRDHNTESAVDCLSNYLSYQELDEEMSLLLVHVFCLRLQWPEAQLEVERLLLWDPKNEKFQQIEKELRGGGAK
ncbi:MAG: O-linked GlcNAc transferase [Bdellovibrio sp. CG10_big_fil_rev_8_21_14_0_10_47_8]|nr:MAG: O-linked GlcNAc transferase [Bdellovibrio sp. CG10_big_fil_rev_8_21_14_0_10_47_8]